ncbi:ATP-binding SpoIIE family protein phosphatase [Streptomyces sp. NPDC026672]|uniref:ATP-binding SpoIIE family protein phosphatase n=1 Tax=unclassified Streptomyces TaxID=2593676 RepID=UPI0033C7E857
MDTRSDAAPVYGSPGSPRDLALASALLDLSGRLDASTYAAYLPVAGRSALGVAMAVDTPCAFTVPSELDVNDLRLPTARAYRNGELVVAEAAELQEICRQVPTLRLHGPFPLALASVPLIAAGRNFGCLSVRWSRTQNPDATVPPEELRDMRRVAEHLAGELLALAERHLPMDAPPIPMFIPQVPAEPPEADVTGTSGRRDWGLTATTFLFKLKRLSTELATAVHARDVLTAAQDQVMTPFGADALMLCRVQDGRLRVVGASHFSREEIGQVDGTPLSRTTPATFAVTHVRTQLTGEVFASTATPRTVPASDDHPRAYVPLIANGRATGCCILQFPPRWRRFPADEDIALATLMLGLIGQTLERIRVSEAEHAFVRAMQRSLLPAILPLRPEVVVTSRYVPASAGVAVGGDWYDVIPLPDGRLGLCVGDVEGHSVEAAGVMGHLRSAVFAYASEGHAPATVLERVDGLLHVLGASRYASCCCLWLDPSTGVAQIATAGHPPPLLSPARGEAATVDVPVGPPLGLGRGHRHEQREITLAPGSVLALFTDGLLQIRALGPDGAFARLADGLAGGDRENMDVLADGLIGDRRLHETLDDDLALRLMRYDGARAGGRRDVARLPIQRDDLKAVASARGCLRELLTRWDAEAILDDLQLILSEVVTNALIHAHSDVEVRMRRHAGGVRLEVQDKSSQPPVPTVILTDESMNAEAESGRGLVIVDALATAWGSSPVGRGKTTWIEMALPE